MEAISHFRRIMRMPPPLIMIALVPTTILTIFFLWSLTPGFSAAVGSLTFDRTQWWRSGMGALTSVCAFGFCAALKLVIDGSRGARLTCIGAWLLLSVGSFPVLFSTSSDMKSSVMSLILNLGITIGISAYLFFSSKAKSYLGSDQLT